jgi:N-acetylmuramoyl-L-alanine amidase
MNARQSGAMQEFAPDFRRAHVVPSPNHDVRAHGHAADILLLHYTGMTSTAAAIERLRDPSAKVSSHYVVQEDGTILQLVPETRRAWHAGVSSWEGVTDINARSIGIEIANPGHSYGYPDFPELQVEAVIALCRDIVARHHIRPRHVLAHSDVAPQRKLDPGEKFPWQRLHRAGIGAWVTPAAAGAAPTLRLGDTGPEVTELQSALRHYGYGVEATGIYDDLTVAVVTAFQRHFRPDHVDGCADGSTVATLRTLLDRHQVK